jgi:hypothetical protein
MVWFGCRVQQRRQRAVVAIVVSCREEKKAEADPEQAHRRHLATFADLIDDVPFFRISAPHHPRTTAMASLDRTVLLPQCASCIRRVTRLSLNARPLSLPLQQIRSKSKAARDAERNVVVKLRTDVPRFGRAGRLDECHCGCLLMPRKGPTHPLRLAP